MTVRLIPGDCRRAMRLMAARGIMVDSIVTDPPYHLTSIVKRFGADGAAAAKDRDGLYKRASAGFMGKQWDGGDIAFDPETWRLALAVLKPGGHMLCFGGTRGWHRLACAIEDAGFEIRDTVAWLYGSGFPKSHDVGKAIDAADAIGFRHERALRFTEWMRSTGISARRINEITGSSMASHYLTDKEQPEIATADMFYLLRPYLPVVPGWVEDLIRSREIESENLKKRPIIGKHPSPAKPAKDTFNASFGEALLTAPATPEAAQWQGWGTALKPAFEPIILARKPLQEKSVAANVLRHGTGAINVDGCRVEGNVPSTGQGTSDRIYGGGKGLRPAELGTQQFDPHPEGRWPANVCHDGSEEVEAAFAAFGNCHAEGGQARPVSGADNMFGVRGGVEKALYSDSGTAARFFYSAKADAHDRLGSKHPTVKPVALMRWLVRLITPPGGLVLDPFAGSGTTGVAALAEGFHAVLIEKEAEYQADIRERLAHYAGEGRHSLAAKARRKEKPASHGPLFGAAE